MSAFDISLASGLAAPRWQRGAHLAGSAPREFSMEVPKPVRWRVLARGLPCNAADGRRGLPPRRGSP